jgi:phage recombination protein Bet
MTAEIQKFVPAPQVLVMADRLSLDGEEMHRILVNTILPDDKKQRSNELINAFLVIANEYKLNPIAKEVYAFPTKGGGLQAVVSIDGWLKIINSNSKFDGMEFNDHLNQNGVITACTCRIYRTDRQRPVEVTEYLNECQGKTKDSYGNLTPWGKYPARMLRHKATIQAARYAFGLSGIIDPDEADRYEESGTIEQDITPTETTENVIQFMPDEKFNKQFPKWEMKIKQGKGDVKKLIETASDKGFSFSDEQLTQLNLIEVQNNEAA